jgi:hypothetical protein
MQIIISVIANYREREYDLPFHEKSMTVSWATNQGKVTPPLVVIH